MAKKKTNSKPVPVSPSTGRRTKEVSLVSSSITLVAFSELCPSSENPRRDFHSPEEQEASDQLGDSILEHGIIEPLVVEPAEEVDDEVFALSIKRGQEVHPALNPDNVKYFIRAGERRWRTIIANLGEYLERHESVPIYIIRSKHKPDQKDKRDLERLMISMAENTHRTKPNPIDLAIKYSQMLNLLKKIDPKATHADLAKAVNLHQTQISMFICLLKLPPDIQRALYERKITPPEAHQLNKFTDPNVRAELLEMKKGRKTADYQRALKTRLIVGSIKQAPVTVTHLPSRDDTLPPPGPATKSSAHHGGYTAKQMADMKRIQKELEEQRLEEEAKSKCLCHACGDDSCERNPAYYPNPRINRKA